MRIRRERNGRKGKELKPSEVRGKGERQRRRREGKERYSQWYTGENELPGEVKRK